MKFTIATLFLAAIFSMVIAAPVELKREEAAVDGTFEEEKSIVLVRVKGEEIEEAAS
ncbi:hypothetical protein ACMFMG_009970 [Clarireedia jacksonii]